MSTTCIKSVALFAREIQPPAAPNKHELIKGLRVVVDGQLKSKICPTLSNMRPVFFL